jgi:hypothetical protein
VQVNALALINDFVAELHLEAVWNKLVKCGQCDVDKSCGGLRVLADAANKVVVALQMA